MPRQSTPVDATDPGAPLSRKGAETRRRLVEAAKWVFEDAGFLEARISDISKRAGLSHGAFYHYFDSKEEIFREIAAATERSLTAPHTPSSASNPPLKSHRDRIRRANRRYLEHYRDDAAIMGRIEQVSRYDEPVKKERAATQKHFADRAELSIRKLQRDGLADPDLDPAIAAMALGAMVARFAELWFVQGYADYDFDEGVEQLTALWCNALGLKEELG